MQQAITFDDVLLVPAYNHCDSRKEVDTSITDKTGKLKLDLPIFTANMDTITESEMAIWISTKGGCGVLHRFMSIEENADQFEKSPNNTFISLGCSEEEKKRFALLYLMGARNFCVDVAHGHAKYVGKMIKWMKGECGEKICIMAGNVATYAGADYLSSCGSDIIKVGIGPGSVCTTRIKTGFGVPQLTAIQECARVGKSIVADGGIKTPGDIVKALAFGADFVMLGGMLAGTHFTPGSITFADGTLPSGRGVISNRSDVFYKTYRGMASKEVADDHLGGLTEWKTAEGVATTVPYINEERSNAIIHDIIGGLRSGLTYGGAKTIRELQQKMDYRIITPAGRIESLPHKTL